MRVTIQQESKGVCAIDSHKVHVLVHAEDDATAIEEEASNFESSTMMYEKRLSACNESIDEIDCSGLSETLRSVRPAPFAFTSHSLEQQNHCVD